MLELEDGNIEALAMHKFEYALSSMIGREAAFSLQMRYLSKEERENATGILENESKDELHKTIEMEKLWLN